MGTANLDIGANSLSATGVISGGNVTIAGGGSLSSNGSVTSLTTTGNASVTGSGGTLTINAITAVATLTTAGPVTISSGSVTNLANSGTLSVTGTISGSINNTGGALILNSNTNAGAITNTGGSIDIGTNDLIATSITGGSVTVAGGGSISSNGGINTLNTSGSVSITGSGGTLTIGSIPTAADLTTAGPVTITSGTVTSLVNGGTLSFAGTISGTVDNNSTMTITGVSSTGVFDNTGGTLSLNAGLTASSITGDNVTIAGGGSLTSNGSVTSLTTTGNASVTGSGGTLTINAITAVATLTTAGPVTISSGSVTNLANSGTLSVTGTISGTITNTVGALTLNSDINSGAITITSGSIDIGTTDLTATSITGGPVTVAGGGSISSNGSISTLNTSGNVSITGSGGTLTIGSIPTAADLTTAGPVTITSGTVTSLVNGGTLSFAGTISGTVDNNSTMTITGVSSTGVFDNTGGTLSLNANLTAGAITNAGASITVSGGSLSATSIAGGTVTYNGTGNQTFIPLPGTYNVTVNKPSGNFTVNTNPLNCTTLTISACASATFNTDVTAATLTNAASAFPITFNGNTDITGGASTTFGTSGLVTFGDAIGDVSTFRGGVSHTAGNSVLNGQIISWNTAITLTPLAPPPIATLTLGTDATITTVNGMGTGGDIVLGTISNTASHTLGLTANTRNITVRGAVGGGGTPLAAITVNSASNVRFYSTIDAASLTQTTGTGTAQFDGLITTSGNVSITSTNVTIGVATTSGGIDSGGSVTLTLNGGTLTINDRTLATDIGTFDINAAAGFSQAAGSGTPIVRLAGDISTTGTNISFTNTPQLIGDVALTTGALTAGDIGLPGATRNAAAAWSLGMTSGTGDVHVGPGALGASGAATELGAISLGTCDEVDFTGQIFCTSISQSAGNSTTFHENVTTSGGTTAGIDITATNIILDWLTLTTTTTVPRDISFTGAVTLSGGPVVVNSARNITFTGAVNGDQNLTITNTGVFKTNEDSDITLTAGANFLQNGGGSNQLAGGITTAGGAITFATDVYLFGTGPAEDMTFNSAATTITFTADLHIAAVLGKIINLASPITAQNIVLYAGEINLTGASITTVEDLVLFGSGYSIDDLVSPQSDVDFLFAYPIGASPSRPTSLILGANPNATIQTTFPDFPTTTFPTTAQYDGSFDLGNLTGKTINVGENFYANHISLAATGSWTLRIPNNDNATSNFAEAYWVTVSNCTYTPLDGYVSAAENCTVTSSPGWDDSRPTIAEAYTVYDNVIYVRFSEAIENTNDEINAAVANIYYYDGAAGEQRGFTGAFTNPRCLPGDSTDLSDDIDRFYLQTVQTLPAGIQSRWNTDATGISAGASILAGDTDDSTDRGRSSPTAVAPAHRTSIPYINLPKALGPPTPVYQTLRDSHKNRVTDYYTATPSLATASFAAGETYTAVTDHCRPVLAAVYTGQEAHLDEINPLIQAPYDAHNFIEFRWSEPVTIAGVLANELNKQTTAVMGGITSGGGLEIAGFGHIQNGALSTYERPWMALTPTLNTDTVHAIYRNFSIDGFTLPPVDQTHRMRISIAGLSELHGSLRFWPGYISPIPTPPAGLVTDPSSSITITDASGNTLEAITPPPPVYNKAAITVSNTPAGLYGPWDITPPDLAVRRPVGSVWNDPITLTTPYEAVAATSAAIISGVELHFLDNDLSYTSDTYHWRSKVGWCDASDTLLPQASALPLESFGGSRPVANVAYVPTSGGIRESSLVNTEGAFTIYNAGSVVGSAHADSIVSNVDSSFMNPLLDTNESSDPYIRLMLATTWPIYGSQLWIAYNDDGNSLTGFITDLAGNLMPSFTRRLCLDRSPLHMAFSLAGVGRQDLFVLFSKDLDLSATLPVLQNGLEVSLNGTIYYPDGLSLVRGNPRALLFHLSTPVTAEDLVSPTSSLTIRQNGAATYFDPDSGSMVAAPYFVDTDGNYAQVGATHELTNIGIGLVNILYGADNVNKAGLLSATEGALRANGFDGTGRLLDSDITLATQLSLTTAPGALALYFDVKPPTAMMPESYNTAMDASNKLWLPSVITGFNVQGNSDARALSPTVITDVDRLFRNFLIPESDPEIVPGSKVELVMQYGGLYCARLADSADITSIAPWSFVIAETRRQRGGVTILNNVINVNNREKVIVQVDVPSSGNIVIQVFTLDGNVVKILDRGKRGGGTYQYFWDGTNGAGNPVARGLYFIRVVGPDMDEIRKVMVVKD